MKKHFIVVVLLVIVIGIGSVLFYWYQIRPAHIHHDCSWVKMHTDAVPAKIGLTEEQLKAKGLINKCIPEPTHSPGTDPFSISDNYSPWCDISNQQIMDKNKPQKYVPAKDWYEKASQEEYQFCLHDKGL